MFKLVQGTFTILIYFTTYIDYRYYKIKYFTVLCIEHIKTAVWDPEQINERIGFTLIIYVFNFCLWHHQEYFDLKLQEWFLVENVSSLVLICI